MANNLSGKEAIRSLIKEKRILCRQGRPMIIRASGVCHRAPADRPMIDEEAVLNSEPCDAADLWGDLFRQAS